MSILCYLFGHKPMTYGSQGDIGAPYHDGIGRSHRSITALCERCEERFSAGSVIDPLTSEPRTAPQVEAKRQTGGDA